MHGGGVHACTHKQVYGEVACHAWADQLLTLSNTASLGVAYSCPPLLPAEGVIPPGQSRQVGKSCPFCWPFVSWIAGSRGQVLLACLKLAFSLSMHSYIEASIPVRAAAASRSLLPQGARCTHRQPDSPRARRKRQPRNHSAAGTAGEAQAML